MAIVKHSVIAIDRVDGMPAILLPNQHIGVWDQNSKSYYDTGAKVTPEEDANTVEYYQLTKTSQVPSAPSKAGGYASRSELDNALTTAGLSLQPKSVSDTWRYEFFAIDTLRYVRDENVKDKVVLKHRYDYTYTLLYHNYAPSPVISVNESSSEIIITNPDGTVVKQKFATTDSVDALQQLLAGLRKQVDKAIYSYEGQGKPTMTGMPVSDWLQNGDGSSITDSETKAEVFAVHVGDIYYDLANGVSYKFSLREGGSTTNPADYAWELIANSAIDEALRQVSELEGDTVKIWTEQPSDGDSYKPGDIYLYTDTGGVWRYKHCIAANQPPQYVYAEADWVEPYATIKEVADMRQQLTSLSGDLKTAKDNISDLQEQTHEIQTTWIDAIKEGIITEQERQRLEDVSQRIDEEQAQLQSNVDYILASPYFADKDAFRAKSNAVLAAKVGSIDKLQAAIAAAIADNTITEAERIAVQSAFAVYDSTRETLLSAIKDAKTAIDKQIPVSVQVGGRNLLLHTTNAIKTVSWFGWYDYSDRYLSVRGLTKGTYTISFFVLSAVSAQYPNADVKVHVYADVYDKDNNSINQLVTEFIGDEVSAPAKYSHTFDIIDDNVDRVQFSFRTAYGNGAPNIKTTIQYRSIQLERGNVATDWTPAPEDVQAEIDEINAHPAKVDPATKRWMIWDADADAYKLTEWSSVGDDGKAPKIVDGYWHEYDSTKGQYVNTGVRAVGEDGEGALVCSVTRQGEWRTSYRVMDEQGNVLDRPIPIKRVIGGVDGKVQIRATIRKGSKDVTETARTNGGNFQWYLNDSLIASNVATLNLGIGDHVDGEDDNIDFAFDDANASKW